MTDASRVLATAGLNNEEFYNFLSFFENIPVNNEIRKQSRFIVRLLVIWDTPGVVKQMVRHISEAGRRTGFDTSMFVCLNAVCKYLSENKHSDLCHLHHKLGAFYNRDEKCLVGGKNWTFK